MNPGAFGIGFALGGTLIVAIGAQNAFVLRQGLRDPRGGWLRYTAVGGRHFIGSGEATVQEPALGSR